jgi:intein-encoded DNA endonuclease-like protein
MPIHKEVNQNFFKQWSPEMAYVLGFFTADGNIVKNKRGSHFISLEITDRELLEKIRSILGSDHKITDRKRRENWKTAYRLQIGSKEMFNDLKILKVRPKKDSSGIIKIIPENLLKDFIRGFFDGDGFVCRYKRKDRNEKMISCGFVFSEKEFLENIFEKLILFKIVAGGMFNYHDRVWRLSFPKKDAYSLWRFMYQDPVSVYLNRKKAVFDSYFAMC